VKIVKMTPAGKDVILEIFGTGDPFGAVAAYEGRPFPVSAIALEDTVCLVTPRPEFFSLLETHPSLVRGLLLGLTQRLVELTNRLTEMTGGRVEARFARLFLKLGENVGRAGGDGTIVPMHNDRNLHPHHEPLGQGRDRAHREGRVRDPRQTHARGAGSLLVILHIRKVFVLTPCSFTPFP
jgi:CRP-like cAMP-binding protein